MPQTGHALRRLAPSPRAAGPGPAGAPRAARPLDAVLGSLPSHGWTAGWVGRRDRALLVLWQQAGLSFDDIAGLTIGDIAIGAGVATVRPAGGEPVTLRMTENGLLCGPCALSRWLHALDLAALHSDGRVVASVIGRAAPLTAHSPHVCEGSTVPTEDTAGHPVFPADDRWATPPIVRTLPAPARPWHDLRQRTAARPHQHPRYAALARGDADRADAASTAPIDGASRLENRARALLGDPA